jgi:lysophospholipase L1-like esterase
MSSWKRAWRPAAVAAAGLGLTVTALIGIPSAHAAAGDGSTTDTNISFVGRWDRSSTARFVANWAGAYFRVGFTGTTVKLKQRNAIDLWASIDGGAFVAYKSVSGTVNLTSTPLRSGNHTLIVSYRQVAGSYKGDAVFAGLTLDAGARTFAPPARPKRVEFVGDSITAGATSSKLAVTDYAFVVGERLGVDHTQIAIGGMCLTETSDGCWGHEQRYFLTNGTLGTAAWDFSRFTADAVVINLGTNDRSHSVSGADFQAKYITFLRDIRAKYPRAKLLAMRTFIGRYGTETQAAVQARNAAGDTNVHYIDTTGWLPSDGLSDSVHPNDSGHRAIADRLAPVLTSHLGATTAPIGTIKLVNRNSGKVLAVSASSTADGAAVVQQTDTGATSQRWDVVDAENGYVKLVNRNSGKLLDVSGRSTADGGAVTQYRDTGGTNQHWQLVSSDGYSKLVNRNSGKVLEVNARSTAEGSSIVQWTDNGGTNQEWTTPAG